MDVETILDYISETPENTNTNILKEMLQDLSGSGGGRVAKEIEYLVEAPTEDNPDDTLKFVVLTNVPQTKYQGYTYIITGQEGAPIVLRSDIPPATVGDSIVGTAVVGGSSGGGGGISYIAGNNIQINGNVISATDTKYTAGEGVSISSNNVISAEGRQYYAGDNISIDENNYISAIDTTYVAGTHMQIVENIINCTLTSLSPVQGGTNLSLVTSGDKYNWNNKLDQTSKAQSASIADSLVYTTIAPTEANTNGIKIVVLDTEPAVKYSGYIYLITASES